MTLSDEDEEVSEQESLEIEDLKDEETADVGVPCAAEYASACSRMGLVRCGKWWRACSLKSTECLLHHYGVGAQGAIPMAASLALNEMLHLLDLTDNGLGPEGTRAFLQALCKGGAPALRVLMLSRNQAGAEGAEAVRDLLQAVPHHPLERLDMTANCIGDRGVKHIADGLRENQSLTTCERQSTTVPPTL